MSFAIFVVATAALLALFLPFKQVLLIVLAGAAGILTDVFGDWLIPAKGAYQLRYLQLALPLLCALAAVLGYLWPWKAWQWGLVPFLALAIWQVAGPYATVHWGNLGPIPFVFPFYTAVLTAIPAMIAAELAAYVSRQRGAYRD